jgi:hypothetical protein
MLPGVSYNLEMSRAAWELIFMMVILKIPIVYLVLVVWYAIRAEPAPGTDPNDHPVWRPWSRAGGPRPRRGGPHGSRDTARTVRARRGRVAS